MCRDLNSGEKFVNTKREMPANNTNNNARRINSLLYNDIEANSVHPP